MPQPEIDALRARWESERSPSRTLQLAEAYKTAGDLRAALEVLEAGLIEHPDHPAARVAKGRCHLDLGETGGGIRELVKVARFDPSHLLANKLLVEAHTKNGELERARDRLDLFALLGGVGSEVEALERRIENFEPATPPTPEVPTAETSSDEPFSLPVASGVTALRLEEVGPAYPAPQRPSVRDEAPVLAGDDEPFAWIDWLDVDEVSYRTALFGEGLFSQRPSNGASQAAVSQDVGATLTLADLYRKQGHDQEAAGILREILGRQPGNVEAVRGLNAIEGRQSWPLSADDLMGESDSEGEGSEGNTVGRLLRSYRARLRRRDS